MGDLSDVEGVGSPFGATLSGGGLDTTTAAGRLLALLEERVSSLVERHAVARKTIEELQAALVERDARMSRMASEHDQLKAQLRERLSAVIERVAELESEHAQAGEDAP